MTPRRHPAQVTWRLVLGVALGSLSIAPALGQIYKYKDEQGRWQFSDKPPPEATPAELIETKPRKGPLGKDLAARLSKAFDPKTPLETATLAVVTVLTPAGLGSAFFVTDDGYMLTNRHVVRPAQTELWRQLEDEFDAAKARFQAVEADLTRLATEVGKRRQQLEALERRIKTETSSSDRNRMIALRDRLTQTYENRRKEYWRLRKRVDSRRREFERARSEFNRLGAAATLASNFEIVLKDDTRAYARLVSVSKNVDLALLKLDGYSTPFLERADVDLLEPGVRVFAIGSPLGIRDAVSIGFVARVRPDEIVFDAQVLPGNSGGPLLTETGAALGVNTTKLTEGFGLAIALSTALEEFPTLREAFKASNGAN